MNKTNEEHLANLYKNFIIVYGLENDKLVNMLLNGRYFDLAEVVWNDMEKFRKVVCSIGILQTIAFHKKDKAFEILVDNSTQLLNRHAILNEISWFQLRYGYVKYDQNYYVGKERYEYLKTVEIAKKILNAKEVGDKENLFSKIIDGAFADLNNSCSVDGINSNNNFYKAENHGYIERL